MTAASVNPSCFKESISYPHLIWATVEMLNIMCGQHISSVNYFWKNFLVWLSIWTLWNTAAGSSVLPVGLLEHHFFWFICGSFWRKEVAWVVRELHFNLRQLSRSHKIFLCYPLQYLNRLFSEFKLFPYEKACIELALQSSVYFRFVHK